MKKIIHIITGIMIMISSNFTHLYAQGGAVNNTPGAGSNVLGWDGTVGAGVQDITLENQFANKNITFNTNNTGTNGSSTTKMTILGNTGSTSGYVGIGIASPSQLFQVAGGNVDVNTSTNSYMINENPVLWHNGDPTSIFVGVGAGNSGINAAGGIDNTLVGNNAGTAITSGRFNSYVGFEAGYNNLDAETNTAVGYQALHTVTNNGQNVAVGYKALYSVTTICGGCSGGENAAVGYRALEKSDAYGCCALGFEAAVENRSGCSLVAIGEEALHSNIKGNENVAVGHDALLNNQYFSDNVAIGTSALQVQGTSFGGTHESSSANVAVGKYALYGNDPTTAGNGIDNTAVGYDAGSVNQTGKYNSFLGYNANVGRVGLQNATAIGYNSEVKTDNTMILGNQDVNVGIGLSGVAGGPLAKMHVLKPMTGTDAGPIAAKIVNNDVDVAGFYGGLAYGLTVNADGNNRQNMGGYFVAENASTNQAGHFKTEGVLSGSSNHTNIATDCNAGYAIND